MSFTLSPQAFIALALATGFAIEVVFLILRYLHFGANKVTNKSVFLTPILGFAAILILAINPYPELLEYIFVFLFLLTSVLVHHFKKIILPRFSLLAGLSLFFAILLYVLMQDMFIIHLTFFLTTLLLAASLLRKHHYILLYALYIVLLLNATVFFVLSAIPIAFAFPEVQQTFDSFIRIATIAASLQYASLLLYYVGVFFTNRNVKIGAERKNMMKEYDFLRQFGYFPKLQFSLLDSIILVAFTSMLFFSYSYYPQYDLEIFMLSLAAIGLLSENKLLTTTVGSAN